MEKEIVTKEHFEDRIKKFTQQRRQTLRHVAKKQAKSDVKFKEQQLQLHTLLKELVKLTNQRCLKHNDSKSAQLYISINNDLITLKIHDKTWTIISMKDGPFAGFYIKETCSFKEPEHTLSAKEMAECATKKVIEKIVDDKLQLESITKNNETDDEETDFPASWKFVAGISGIMFLLFLLLSYIFKLN